MARQLNTRQDRAASRSAVPPTITTIDTLHSHHTSKRHHVATGQGRRGQGCPGCFLLQGALALSVRFIPTATPGRLLRRPGMP